MVDCEKYLKLPFVAVVVLLAGDEELGVRFGPADP